MTPLNYLLPLPYKNGPRQCWQTDNKILTKLIRNSLLNQSFERDMKDIKRGGIKPQPHSTGGHIAAGNMQHTDHILLLHTIGPQGWVQGSQNGSKPHTFWISFSVIYPVFRGVSCWHN